MPSSRGSSPGSPALREGSLLLSHWESPKGNNTYKYIEQCVARCVSLYLSVTCHHSRLSPAKPCLPH